MIPPSTPPPRCGAPRWRNSGAPTKPHSPRSPRQGTVHVVKGSGHNVYQDALEVSVAAIRRVLNTVNLDS